MEDDVWADLAECGGDLLLGANVQLVIGDVLVTFW